MRLQCLMAVPEYCGALVVAPIMDNLLEYVDISARRNALKEVAGDHLASLPYSLGLERFPRCGSDVWQIEQNASHLGFAFSIAARRMPCAHRHLPPFQTWRSNPLRRSRK